MYASFPKEIKIGHLLLQHPLCHMAFVLPMSLTILRTCSVHAVPRASILLCLQCGYNSSKDLPVRTSPE